MGFFKQNYAKTVGVCQAVGGETFKKRQPAT